MAVVQPRVVPACRSHHGARLDGEACSPPVVQVVHAGEPVFVADAAQQAGLATQLPAMQGVDGAGVHAGDVAQAAGHRFEHAGEVQAGSELEAGLVDLPQAGRAVVERRVDAGVGDRLRGDLCEPAQEVGVRDIGVREVEERRDADDLAAVDEGELDEAVEPEAEVLGALDLREARVVGDVRDHHRLAEVDGSPRDREVREFVDGARERLVDGRSVGAHEPHEAFALDRGDVAARRGGREAHAGRHRVEDLGEVERCSELQARLREHAELLVGLRQPLEEEQVVEGGGDQLAHASREVHVVGEAARTDVEDVDEADEAVVDDERDGELAGEAVALPQTPLVRREPGVVQPGEHQEVVAAHRGSGSVAAHACAVGRGGLVTGQAPVDTDEAAQLAVVDLVDLAAGRAQHVEQALRDEGRHVLGAAGRVDARAELHDLAE